jgi:hypothetical protein
MKLNAQSFLAENTNDHHSVFTVKKWIEIFTSLGFTPCDGYFDHVNYGYLFGNTRFRDHADQSLYACLKKQ